MAIQHLLFPTDFSDPAQHAGTYAAALARGTGARVTILHVLLAPYPAGTMAPGERLEAARRLTVQEEERAHAMLAALTGAGAFRDLPVQTLLRTGPVEHEILRAVRQDPADLVVMGTHGRGMVGRAVLGGVTAKVVRLSPRPVLVVRWPGARIRMPWGKVLVGAPTRPGGPAFGRIVVALDGSALAEAILAEVQALAAPFGATLILVRVVERPNYPMIDTTSVQARETEAALRYLDRVKGELEAQGFRVRTEALFGDPAAAILEHAAKIDADAIAMATHGRSGLDRWLLGSVVEKVLTGSETPVLVCRAWTEAG